jgi:CRISPR-associated protein Cas2
MFFVVIYDIRDVKRLHKVAKVMESYGQRVQKSIFECELEGLAFLKMRTQVEHMIDPDEDSVKYFRLCSKCFEKGLAMGQCTRMLPLKEVEII